MMMTFETLASRFALDEKAFMAAVLKPSMDWFVDGKPVVLDTEELISAALRGRIIERGPDGELCIRQRSPRSEPLGPQARAPRECCDGQYRPQSESEGGQA